MLESFSLEGRVAVVTAASRGIGAGIARGLAEAGAAVVIGARSPDDLAAVAAGISEQGGRAEYVAGDLGSREGMEELVERATGTFGRLDIVVNNAGGSLPQAFLDTSEKRMAKALEWNVLTAFNLTQVAAPHLLATEKGSVINIASAAGRFAARGFVAYGTAKAAMIAMAANLAADLAPKVRVNTIAPGAIATDALELVTEDENLKQELIANTPMRRIGEVADVAAAAVFLASEASSYLTGAVLPVDGGIQHPNLTMPIEDL